jgi:hypothetical protein
MLVLHACLTNAQQVKDTIYLTSGSKIVGKIKRIKMGVITFDPDDANDVTVQMNKLKTMAAISKRFRIESTKQKVFFGKILPHDTAGYATFYSETDTILHSLQQISVLYPIRKRFIQRFTGQVKAGFDYTRSSGLGRVNYDGQLNYTAKKIEVSFYTSGIYTITDTSFSRDREDINVKDNYYFNPTWFATFLLKYQRNLELGLLRRYQEGVGAGNKIITTERIYAWTRGGFVLNQEKNTEDSTTGTLAELFAQLEFNFFRFVKPKLSFSIGETIYGSLSQKGRIRNDAQFSLNWEIIRYLNLSISLYSNFDNQPPSAESSKFDRGVIFNIGYTFY